MLMLSRRVGEIIIVQNGDETIQIKVVEIIGSNKVRIGIDAPEEYSIVRAEIVENIKNENMVAAKGAMDTIEKIKETYVNNKKREKKWVKF